MLSGTLLCGESDISPPVLFLNLKIGKNCKDTFKEYIYTFKWYHLYTYLYVDMYIDDTISFTSLHSI